ncbi:MAG: GNAT family N-acetyltransferase [Arenimonas sp.]
MNARLRESAATTEFRQASGAAELEAIARLRYEILVRHHDRRPDGTDDERGTVSDADDAISTHLAAFDGIDPVACVRMTPVSALPADSRWRKYFEFAQFPVEEERQVLLTYLLVRPDRRDTDTASRLIEQAYEACREQGCELIYMLAAPNLVSLYEVLGFRRYTTSGIDLGGLRLPMVMIAGDLHHFETVRSPLLDALRKNVPDVRLGDWFESTFPVYSRPASQRALAVEDFMLGLAQRINDAGIPLLDDLDGMETTRLLAAARQLGVAAGDLVLSEGDRGDDMFLILEGAVEVSRQLPRGRRVLTTLGAGQIFGEGAFLLGTPRSADVTALGECHLLACNTTEFEALSAFDAQIAIKLLRNLSRMLCLRLYAGSAA